MRMYASSLPVAPGSWHTPGAGLAQVQAMGRHMVDFQAAHDRARSGGFNQRIAQMARAQQPKPMPQMPMAQPMPQQPMQVGTQPTQPLYSQGHTQRMINRAFGNAMQQADPRMAQQGLMGRGLSLDAGTMAAATPAMAEGYSNALQARNVIPLQDALANQQWKLQGQQMQGQEFLGLAGILRQMQQNRDAQQQMAIGPLLSAALG